MTKPTDGSCKVVDSNLAKVFHNYLLQFDFNQFITLVTNYDDVIDEEAKIERRIANLKDKVGQWEARLNRKLLGRDWQKSSDRFFAIYFLEHIQTNAHAHMLAVFPRIDEDKNLGEMVNTAWLDLMPKGSTDVQVIDHLVGATSYVTKSLNSPKNWEHFEFIGPVPEDR